MMPNRNRIPSSQNLPRPAMAEPSALPPLVQPLRFAPLFRDAIWGGRRLASHFPALADGARMAEVWLLSGHPSGLTPVAEGPLQGATLPDLIAGYGTQLLGQGQAEVLRHGRFPLLFKLLDVAEWLSVQVHPATGDRSLQAEIYGKTEMWLALWAAAEARLILGLQEGCTREALERAGPTSALTTLLQQEPVCAGQAYFVPAGTVHALGPGMTMLEVQECSDTTYRLYDWDRPADPHRPRPLHWQQALQVLDARIGPPGAVQPVPVHWHGLPARQLASCPAFQTLHVALSPDGPGLCQSPAHTFAVLIGLDGTCRLEAPSWTQTLHRWDCILVPATLGSFTISTAADAEFLVVHIPERNP